MSMSMSPHRLDIKRNLALACLEHKVLADLVERRRKYRVHLDLASEREVLRLGIKGEAELWANGTELCSEHCETDRRYAGREPPNCAVYTSSIVI